MPMNARPIARAMNADAEMSSMAAKIVKREQIQFMPANPVEVYEETAGYDYTYKLYGDSKAEVFLHKDGAGIAIRKRNVSREYPIDASTFDQIHEVFRHVPSNVRYDIYSDLIGLHLLLTVGEAVIKHGQGDLDGILFHVPKWDKLYAFYNLYDRMYGYP